MTISYEDIYELLRTEKYSADLQPLKPQDLVKIKEYFALKEEMLKKQKSSTVFFDRSKQDKIVIEIENAWRALRDLYERREKKIINRALFTSRTNFKLKDSTNMLASEEKLYSLLIDLLRRNNMEFFENFGIKIKYENEKTDARPEKEATKALKEGKEVAIKAVEDNLTAASEADKVIGPKPKKLIRFTEAVSELVDTDLQACGPFEKEDIANLPEELANLLIRQNKAKEIATDENR